MSLKRLVAPAVVTALLGGTLTALTAPAAAEPSWTAPDRAPGERVDLEGNGAGWIWNSSGSVRRDPSGTWSVGNDHFWRPGVTTAIDAYGNEAGVGLEDTGHCEMDYGGNLGREDENFTITVGYRRVGGSWRTQTLPGSWDACPGLSLKVAMDDAGTATVVWPGDGQLLTSRRVGAGRWTDPQPLGPVVSEYGTTPELDLATDGDGRAVAVWETPGGDLVQAVRSGAGRWSAPRVLDADVPGSLLELRLVGGAPEPVVATWVERDTVDNSSRLRAAFRGVDGRWRRPGTVAAAPGWIGRVSSTVHAKAATVAWFKGTDTRGGSVRAASGRLKGWSDPVVLGARLPRGTAPSVAASQLGTVVAWTAGDAESSWTMTALRRAGETGWSRRRLGAPVPLQADDLRNWQGAHDGAPRSIAYRPNQLTVLYTRHGASFSEFVDDTTPPRVRLRSRLRYLDPPWLPLRWKGLDDLTGARNFDVRVRTAGIRGRLSGWDRWKTRVSVGRARHRVHPGGTYCFSARARDRAGNRGRWSPMRCTSVPADDRALRASAGWRRVENRAAYRGTLTVAGRRGQRLRLDGVVARRLSLVVHTCPRCGTVRVRHGGRDLGVVDLRGPVHPERVIPLRRLGRVRKAPVVIRVTSQGKPVKIDGIIAQR